MLNNIPKYFTLGNLLFNSQHVWIKIERGLFDVTMGAFNRAEVCGNFLPYELSKNYNKKDIGLYRDDGLAIFKNVAPKVAPKQKKLKKIYKKYLKITT